VLCGLILPGLAACSGNRPSWFGGSTKVAAAVDPGINQNNPVRVEVVIVYDASLLEKLKSTSAADWFQRREQIRRDYPDDQGFVSRYWEWVPGQTVDPEEISFGTGARGGLVFADYLNNQDNRVFFDPHESIKIHLADSTFTVEKVE
jgi:type VI secretion system protein